MIQSKNFFGEKDLIEKSEVVNKLIEYGYNASLETGVILCHIKDSAEYDQLKEVLNKLNYNASFGVIYDNKPISNNRPKDPRLTELYNKGIEIYSISRLDTINNCLYAAYRSYILKEKGKGNIYSTLGSSIHSTLEDITNGSATEQDLLPALQNELDNLEALGIEFPKDRNGGDAIRDNWIADMTNFCNTYKAPQGKDLTTEELFIYQTPDGHYLQGYIDLQRKHKDGSISIYDYKTSTMYSAAEMKSHVRQLILYALGKEQEGYKVRSASWIFLKYVTVTFMGYKTKNSKHKTQIIKHIERRKLGNELSNYIDVDMIECGFDELERQFMLDKFNNQNIIDVLPPQISARYSVKPCVISVELNEESRQECIDYISKTIATWTSLNREDELEFPPKSFKKERNGREVSDTFFCTSLCDHFEKCHYIHDYLDQAQNENDEDDLFS